MTHAPMHDTTQGAQSRSARRTLLKSMFAILALSAGLAACGSGGDEEVRYHASWTGALSDAAQSLPGFPPARRAGLR